MFLQPVKSKEGLSAAPMNRKTGLNLFLNLKVPLNGLQQHHYIPTEIFATFIHNPYDYYGFFGKAKYAWIVF